jgi:hypothetical protein
MTGDVEARIRELNSLLDPENPNYHAYQVQNIKAVISLYEKGLRSHQRRRRDDPGLGFKGELNE